MADIDKKTDGPTTDDAAGFDFTKLPDFDKDFVDDAGIIEFAKALAAPEPSPSNEDLLSAAPQQPTSLFITALNDWKPIRQRVRKRSSRKPRRGKDETREGYVYGLLKWPLLFTVFGWIVFLGISYILTRFYIYLYEHWVTWRGARERLRRKLNSSKSYEDWVESARELDAFLGNDTWKRQDEYAYYDSKTVRRVKNNLREYRKRAEDEEHDSVTNGTLSPNRKPTAIHELRELLEACVKNNFSGFENPKLYSETYFGTKNLLQDFVEEVGESLSLILRTSQLSRDAKREFFRHLHTNYGRSALCLSGGATFAYYHIGVAKAMLDANLLPDVITGTSGGALVAALLATRNNDELKQLLVPALAHKITACHDSTWTWMKRWWQTGARFDSIDWACRCSWFTRGSMTFREAYVRTGRVLNVACVPSDPHSPAILANYLTSPDCVIWSAVIASAAVPGILNPVVLMKKVKVIDRDTGEETERLEPYSFGHKWKDGSLRTDIPLRALNLHFNVNFAIVSQVNPHVNLFFFSSRGSVGRPVTHRKGRGWRGGYMGSALEQYLKLDMTKWLKVLRHLELLPRPMGQDWSEIWLQQFSGTITIWPKTIPSDFYYILTDPTPQRLARMIRVGQLCAWPKLKFIGNRIKLERLIDEGRRSTRPVRPRPGGDGMETIFSEDDLRGLLEKAQKNNGAITQNISGVDGTREHAVSCYSPSGSDADDSDIEDERAAQENLMPTPPIHRAESPSISQRLGGWWRSISPSNSRSPKKVNSPPHIIVPPRTTSNDSKLKHMPASAAPHLYSYDRPQSMFELRPDTPRTKQVSWEEEQRRLDTLMAYREAQIQHRRRASLVDELRRQSLVFFDDGFDAEDDVEPVFSHEGDGNAHGFADAEDNSWREGGKQRATARRSTRTD
ncbi:patatin-domain-containing protein [Rhizodiscina lignyota]|uniref:Patatin-domain-containing protein n=1 Tax=Rhizodiscina lignyota TaxID=1504668 RepID=A0A9P4I2G9_9PEZI|nr:patatin-domain-containing protein [Rhizodiscina lignyota]